MSWTGHPIDVSNILIARILGLLGVSVWSGHGVEDVSRAAAGSLIRVISSELTTGIATVTYLQHSDPTVPYYVGQWTFLRDKLSDATEVIKPVLGGYYDSTALWRSFMQCKIIESTGDVVFLKDVRHEAVRECPLASPVAETRST
ncbi:uncharacterized protein B0H18DRAFT_1125814 [Fomitopsis serialis]|uniref:uncharacterized protein n=1 Tax=Fomitopsis serialis TaxID=139415 RepID=UPI002007CCE8|nr:uncharacterized protein B0H18DRAFT_1125814 [Neoantrodia serialis]KAH9914149.1 hypothetical protein B0H18DRAFT_1125814 [Neoantrodia serialis]